MNIGDRLKMIRKNKGLSQKELCNDICSQGMLSQIENNHHISNIQILTQLCNRLNISLNEIVNYSSNEINSKQVLFNTLAELFYRREYQEIYNLIMDNQNSYNYKEVDKQIILFYEALFYGFVQHDYHKAYELLEESVCITYYSQKVQLTYEEILIITNLGIITMKLGLKDDTHYYFDLIIKNLQENRKIKNKEKITIIFFNIANGYSKMGDYEKALEIACKGIAWANAPNINTQIRLSYLYYEKAYNEQMLQIDNYVESYKIAYYLALNSNDKFLMKFIKTKILID